MSTPEEDRKLTTEQAYNRLGISRATFFNRLKDYPEIKPINYNPNLKRQSNPIWRLSDVDKIGIPLHPEIVGEPLAS